MFEVKRQQKKTVRKRGNGRERAVEENVQSFTRVFGVDAHTIEVKNVFLFEMLNEGMKVW